MNPENAGKKRKQLDGQVLFLRSVVIASIASNVVLSGVVGWFALKDNVKLVPPEIRRSYEIGGGAASKDYLIDMASYVLDKLGTVSPLSVEANNLTILKMTVPEGQAELKPSLDAAAARIKREQMSTVWEARTIKVYEQKKAVEVLGEMKTYISDKLTSEVTRTFVVEFSLNQSGRMYVQNVKEIKKDSKAAASVIGNQ